MSIELAACIVMFAVALPVCRAVAWHYLAMVALNLLFLGCEYADSSILAMSFGAVAAVDSALILSGATLWLIPAFIASTALALESVSNGDWLLSQSTPISIATNAVIIAYLVKEYRAWMSGRPGRSS